MALAALVVSGLVWKYAVEGSEWGGEPFWNDIRLARAYSAWLGVDIYAGPDSGLLPGHLYGPVGFFAYGPALLATTPGRAIQWGIVLSWLMVGVPLWWVLRRTVGGGVSLAGLFLLAMFHFAASPGTGSIRTVHVDAPATGLAVVSCGALIAAIRRQDDRGWLVLTAVTAAGAVWAKQTMAPVVLLPGLALWLAGRSRAAFVVTGMAIGFSALLGLVFGWLYGMGDLWWTMFAVPAKHGRLPGVVFQDSAVVRGLFDVLPLLALPLFLHANGDRKKFVGSGVALAYSLALLPLAMLGRMKVEGAANNYLAPDVFLVLALCLAAGAALRGAGPKRLRPALALVGVLLCVQMGQSAQAVVFTAYRRTVQPRAKPSDEAYAFLRARPGEAYFPWNPLAMHMAEGRPFHSGYGPVTRAKAGYPVSAEQWAEFAPERARWVATPLPLFPSLEGLLPEYAREVRHPELPGWIVFERNNAE